MKQATLKQGFQLSGKGLHTGLELHVMVCPAGENTGIRFCRVDLVSRPSYEAVADIVSKTNRGTVLEKGDFRVSTVEHLMAALYAMGVTNCLIEVDGPEVPILNGSALPWIEQIEAVGVCEQAAEAKVWDVSEPLTFEDGKGSVMKLMPADSYQVQVMVDYQSPIVQRQTAELEDLSLFAEQIAPARTFCFLREIQSMLSLGLIKGGDLENALVIYDRRICQLRMNWLAFRLHKSRIDASKLGYLSELVFENEPARHKLLDLIGDLALVGVRINAKIEAEKPGHGFNTFCAKQLRQLCLKEINK